jgi:hypothetical protein
MTALLQTSAKLETVFGFDHHFTLAGFELWPRL